MTVDRNALHPRIASTEQRLHDRFARARSPRLTRPHRLREQLGGKLVLRAKSRGRSVVAERTAGDQTSSTKSAGPAAGLAITSSVSPLKTPPSHRARWRARTRRGTLRRESPLRSFDSHRSAATRTPPPAALAARFRAENIAMSSWPVPARARSPARRQPSRCPKAKAQERKHNRSHGADSAACEWHARSPGLPRVDRESWLGALQAR